MTPRQTFWADLSLPSVHVVMVSFPQLRWYIELTLYTGDRPPRQLREVTDLLFPVLLSAQSLHLQYDSKREQGSVFRMMFTAHVVTRALRHGSLLIFFFFFFLGGGGVSGFFAWNESVGGGTERERERERGRKDGGGEE